VSSIAFVAGTPLAKWVQQASKHAVSADLAVAFVTSTVPLLDWLKANTPVRLVVALEYPTNPKVLGQLLASQQVEVKYAKNLHAKVFILTNPSGPVAYVGSANLTIPGLGLNPNSPGNIEASVELTKVASIRPLQEWFDDLWQNHARRLDADRLATYKRAYDARAKRAQKLTAAEKAHAAQLTKEFTPYKPVIKDYRAFLDAWHELAELYQLNGGPVAPLTRYRALDQFLSYLHQTYNDTLEFGHLQGESKHKRALRVKKAIAEYHGSDWLKKQRRKYFPMLKKSTGRMEQLLAHDHVARISEAEATEILDNLNSLNRLNQQMKVSAKLPTEPGMLAKLRKSWAYLIWGEDEVEVRINRCLTDKRYRVHHVGKSGSVPVTCDAYFSPH